jgi:5-methylcytosine-specific restriction endonuclease McrA
VALAQVFVDPQWLNSGQPNKRAWKLARSGKHGVGCFYCHQPWTEDVPPTLEHVTPRSHGGTLAHFVLVCQPCNNARGNAPFPLYLKAVERAHAEAERTGGSYRRPKWYQERGVVV